MQSILASRWTRVLVFLLCLVPLGRLGTRAIQQQLGANPIEFITHATGDGTLLLLLACLAITPARKLLKLSGLIRFRRMIGLFAFFYGCLHFTTYIWLDKFFDLPDMFKDVAKRPYITVGFAGFLLLTALAITSTKGWVQRLGGKNWQRLHRVVYLSAVAGVVHYYWLVKSDVTLPVRYGIILMSLLLYRVAASVQKRRVGQGPGQGRPMRAVKDGARAAVSAE
jgi:sulfoxide reductase heme-binding subunit YedZ